MKSPAYQRYPKDYMSDGKVLRMTFEQRGIFDWLLDSCWLEDGIPDDVGELALICGLSERKMASAWERIRGCFEPHPRKPGWLTSGRLEKERTKQAEYSEAMSEAGRKGAAKRWGGHSQASSQATDTPMASDSIAVCSLQVAPEPPLKKRARGARLPDDWEPNEGHREVAFAEGVDVRVQATLMRDWAKANGVTKQDWDATFRNWLRKAKHMNGGGHTRPASGSPASSPGGHPGRPSIASGQGRHVVE